MESSKKADIPASLSTERRRSACFSPDALARVLGETLHLSPDVPLYVAFSGGMDSHVLLHALAQLRVRLAWRISALHIDHGMQPRSREWARRCAEACTALNVPFHAERIVVEDIAARGLEDAARRARYSALARHLPAGAVLLTAHHQDDQAETVLLQLLRGAGVAGLAAMPAITPFAKGHLARPLLGFERRALAAYAAAQQLRWIEDASNRDQRFARNFLRHRVWPAVLEYWPRAAGRIALAARHQAEAGRLLEQLADIDLAAVADAEGGLDIALLLRLAPERQVNLLRHWIRVRGMALPGERVFQQILARVRQPPATRHAVTRWQGAEVRRYRNRLSVCPPESRAPTGWEAVWNIAAPLEIAATGWQLRAQPTIGGGLSRARIAVSPLRVRLRQGGERCRLRGHTRKVKKLLQEAGIPPWERARLPLLYIGSDIVAVGDRWICEPYAARHDEPGIALVLERRPAS